MTDAEQTAESDLVGIKGWLLLYVIWPGIIGTLQGVTLTLIMGSSDFPAYLFVLPVLITANVIGLYLIFRVRKSITQTYHIWLNFIWVSFWAFNAVESGGLVVWGSALGPLIWAAYWIRSKRVRATYCQNAA